MVHLSNAKSLSVHNNIINPLDSSVKKPNLAIKKLGIVSRDYRTRFENGYRDFSFRLTEVLGFLDTRKCDSVLFSLYSIIDRSNFNIRESFRNLQHVRAVFLEKFDDGKERKVKNLIVYYLEENDWREYKLHQKFGSLSGTPAHHLNDFVAKEIPRRVLGNFCVLLCGESNGVKYSQKCRAVKDIFGLRKSIPPEVKVVLNPVHDRMTRFEMNLKRKFLSENDRWMISVWNKGREDRRGIARDGNRPAWKIFHDGQEKEINPIANELDIEFGIVDFKP